MSRPGRHRLRPTRLLVGLTAAAAVAAGTLAIAPQTASTAGPAPLSACPPGYKPATKPQVEQALEARAFAGSQGADLSNALGRSSTQSDRFCVSTKHPESPFEMQAMQAQRGVAKLAPHTTPPPGAHRAAVNQRAEIVAAAAKSGIKGSNGRWRPLGDTPLIVDAPGYGSVNNGGNGLNNGRVDSLEYDPVGKRLFAATGTGGVWMSTNLGKFWRSIGDSLPGQQIGAIGWTKARGGTLIGIGGEPLMGGNTYAGLGGFWTNDLGKTWHRAKGLPDAAMGFQVAVDKSDPKVVYAAMSMGLFRSTDAGRTFKNVKLPTSEKCAGVVGFGECQFANYVTDVVVKAPGGTTNEEGGEVLAAVGYRAGSLIEYPNGVKHAPGNGLYRSDTGAPGTFTKLNVSAANSNSPIGFTTQGRIGRTELGEATGPNQDHNYVYAIVSDAVLFNAGVPFIDVPEEQVTTPAIPNNTSLNGIYVSSDFGSSWTRMADELELQLPVTQSAMIGYAQATFFAPGVQAWYNMWIKPDPTQASGGVPTRLTFGLEELWANRLPTPQNELEAANPASFHAIGPYTSDDYCIFLDLDLPECPVTSTGQGDYTTHADQHDGLYIPDGNGGSYLVAGHDGAINVQHGEAGDALSNDEWTRGEVHGFHTLLPYHAATAKDGTVWFGLQDNGSGKIEPNGRQISAYGGDGFWVAVDPDNSNHAWEEYTYADMNVTTDGGRTWRGDVDPPVTAAQFGNPFVMDPTDADHLLTAGPEVVETVYGVRTGQAGDWRQVFHLGAGNVMSAVELHGDAAYVGFCGVCDVLNNWETGFHNGLATNVGGSKPPKRMTSQGWHKAAAKGLPNRYITSIAADPKDPKTVFVTLGGYNNREWVPPGSYLDTNSRIGEGHVFMSKNAGKSFVDVSGNLPDTEASAVEIHGKQLVVGTDLGAFISNNRKGTRWTALGGDGLPATPVTSIQHMPGERKLLIVSTFGRGVYCYQFPGKVRGGCANLGRVNPEVDKPRTPNEPGNRNNPNAGPDGIAATGLTVGAPIAAAVLLGVGLTVAWLRRRGRADELG